MATAQDLLIASSSAGLTPEESALISRTAYVEAKVYVDTELIEVGDGSQATPFNNFNTAKDYAEANGIYKLVVHGECTIPGNFKNFIVEGVGVPIIHTNGQYLNNSKFYQCNMNGTYTGTIIVQDGVLADGFSLDGFFENSMLAGNLVCNANAVVLIAGCFSGIAGLGRPTVSMNTGSMAKLSVRSYSGGLTITDADHIDDEVTVEILQGSLTFDNTCVAGTMVARGLCKFVDETNGATVVDETSYNTITELEHLVDYNEGSWKIIANQMIYYKRDGSELMRFDLSDSAGNPVTRGATQRVKVV